VVPSAMAVLSSFWSFGITPDVLVHQYSSAQLVLLVVSLPAMSWVSASAVSSSLPSLLPFSSLPSISLASRSFRSFFSTSGASRRALTRAVAMPARFSTARTPFLKKLSGRYFAYGFMDGKQPIVPETSPRRLSTSMAGAYVRGELGPLCTSATSLPLGSMPKGAPNACRKKNHQPKSVAAVNTKGVSLTRSPIISKAK